MISLLASFIGLFVAAFGAANSRTDAAHSFPAADSIGDGGPARAAVLVAPGGLAVDRAGNIYVAERAAHRVRRVDGRTGIITTWAGTGSKGYSGDGGPGSAARLDTPTDLAVDAAGNLYIADTWNARIRRVDARTGVITTVAGNGKGGFSGDGGPAVGASLNGPFGIAIGPNGDLYIADTENQRLRRVTAATGIITTIAGNGESSYAGDGGPAIAASFARPHNFAVLPNGDILIGDSFNQRIRRIEAATGRIATIGGNGLFGSGGDGGPATRASITYTAGLVIDPQGNLVYSDLAAHRIRRIDLRTGVINTIAGDGRWDFGGDGGPARDASFHLPSSLAYDGDGNLLVVDKWNGRVRRIDARTGRVETIIGSRLSPPTPEVDFHFHYQPDSTRAQLDAVVAVAAPPDAPIRRERIELDVPGADPLPIDLYIPGSAARSPLVLLLHGRNNTEFAPTTWRGLESWARLLAANGLAAAVVTHRLGLGAQSLERATGDVRAALDRLAAASAQLPIDARNVCLLSFSGGSTLLVPYFGQSASAVRCLAAFSPHSELEPPALWDWFSEPEAVRQRYTGRLQVTATTPPLFLAIGSGDRPALVEPFARLVTAARAAAPTVEVHQHTTGRHHFDRFSHDAESVAIVNAAVAFLKRQLVR